MSNEKKNEPFKLKIIYDAFEYAENRATVQEDGFMNFQFKVADRGKRVGNRFSYYSVKVLLTPIRPIRARTRNHRLTLNKVKEAFESKAGRTPI